MGYKIVHLKLRNSPLDIEFHRGYFVIKGGYFYNTGGLFCWGAIILQQIKAQDGTFIVNDKNKKGKKNRPNSLRV